MATDGPGWWQSVEPYLDRALEMSAEERRALLQSLGESDPALAARLEDLLGQHGRLSSERFLEDPVVGRATRAYGVLRSSGHRTDGSD